MSFYLNFHSFAFLINDVMKKISFLLIWIMIQSATFAQYKIYKNDGSPVTLDVMIMEVATANVVFFGEQHDDSIAHKAQYDVLTQLHEARNGKVILSMEMFETDVQYIVNEYLKGQITEQSFTKDARAWDNYAKDYKPMVEFMRQKNGQVVAANAPRRYVRMVSRQGLQTLDALDKQAKSYLAKLPVDTLGGRYLERFNKIMGGHTTGMSKIYHAQCVWDATMAESIHKAVKANKDNTVLHLCGKFHCEENLGTVEQLRNKNKKVTIKNIIALKLQEFSELSADEWRSRGDYIIVTD